MNDFNSDRPNEPTDGRPLVTRIPAAFLILLISPLVFAHHSVSSLYDYDAVKSIDGTLTSIRWVNPHVQLKVETVDESGQPVVWQMEASAVNLLNRLGLNRESIKVGDHVIVTGPTSRRGQKTMIAAVIETDDGKVTALFPGSAKRAGLIESRPTIDGSTQRDAVEIEKDRESAHSIFRVWTPRKKATNDVGLGLDDGVAWSLTDSAKEKSEQYKPLRDDPALRCDPIGMPVIMDNPYPMQFIEMGDDIVMHVEFSDGMRHIHMGETKIPNDIEPSALGYSIGHWESNELVITTGKINYPYFDDLGTPQSSKLIFTERYRLSEDETRLDWVAVANDPDVFTEPVHLNGYMEWVVGEEVKEFNCTVPEGFKWQVDDE